MNILAEAVTIPIWLYVIGMIGTLSGALAILVVGVIYPIINSYDTNKAVNEILNVISDEIAKKSEKE